MSIITINGTARLVYVARITIQFSPVGSGTGARENPKRNWKSRHEGKNRFFRTIAELFFFAVVLWFFVFTSSSDAPERVGRRIDCGFKLDGGVPGLWMPGILRISCCNINAFGSTFLWLRGRGCVRKWRYYELKMREFVAQKFEKKIIDILWLRSFISISTDYSNIYRYFRISY